MKNRQLKIRIASCLMAFTVLASPFTAIVAEAKGSSNYNYSSEINSYEVAPAAYQVERVIYAKELRVDSLVGISSTYVTKDRIYLAAADKIVVTDWDFNTLYVLSEYEDKQGNTTKISNPAGIFVTDAGELFVTEPANARILKFNQNYVLTDEFGKPEGLALDIAYSPTQIVVDKLDRMYVVAKNVYEGILELDYDGRFSRYFGVNTVSFTPLDLFWRSIATETQKAKMALWLPTEFTSVSINEEGFIYSTCSSETEKKPIKLLNAKGANVLGYSEDEDYPQGDIEFMVGGDTSGVSGPSTLIAVDDNEHGMYAVLDSKRNRVFTYNEFGDLLYVFGGSGDTKGCFRAPVSVRFLGDKFIVLDQLSQSIILLRPTIYGDLINQATKLQHVGSKDESVPYWEEVVKMNPNLELAYDGIGKASFRVGDFGTAQKMFRLANNRTYYSKAYNKVRNVAMKKNFGVTFTVVIILVVGAFGIRYYRFKKFGKRPGRSED